MTARRKKPPSASPPGPAAQPPAARSEGGMQRRVRAQRARRIIRRYVAVSAAAALLPAAAVDPVVLGALLAKLLHDLCTVYGTALSEHKTKAVLAAVLGGAHAEWITRYVSVYGRRVLPAFPASVRLIARPVVAAGITYSIGMLFLHHFETGAWLQKDWKGAAESEGPRLTALSR